MLCGKLQNHLQNLEELKTIATTNTRGRNTVRGILADTFKSLQHDIAGAVSLENWKPVNEPSGSRDYLTKVSAGFSSLNEYIDTGGTNPGEVCNKLKSAGAACINTKPPSILRGGFVTIKFKTGETVPTAGSSGTINLTDTCPVVSLIKKIGESIKANEFLQKAYHIYPLHEELDTVDYEETSESRMYDSHTSDSERKTKYKLTGSETHEENSGPSESSDSEESSSYSEISSYSSEENE